MSEPLFEMPRSRFTPSVANLESSLAWHAKVTAELQRRVLEAREYVRSHSGDRQLLRILEGAPPIREEVSDAERSTLVHDVPDRLPQAPQDRSPE